jgi:hypothetical protein
MSDFATSSPELELILAEVGAAIARHVQHGHGEILIQIKPDSVRVQEGYGHIFNLRKRKV